MHQLTIRMSDDLAREIAREARVQGVSVNRLICRAVEAVVSPDTIDDDLLRLRARLRAAGLIVEDPPASGHLVSEDQVEQAMRSAGKGKSLTEYVIEGRR